MAHYKKIFNDNWVNGNVQLDRRNASIMGIMKYIASTLETSRASDIRMQSFASKRLRYIAIGKRWRKYATYENSISKSTLRKNNNISTVLSQKLRGGPRDICRWETSESHAYLNNVGGCEIHIRRRVAK